eukprot:TRINITY_DN1263_c0_g1_i4.p1 TRINITY_DN1263_c0_g1~~TRINITY_DN1263_c0_g1_i4.p1  ORF type:complete len:374 (-),score=85.70 TRINITY_DN1263_c0_g1_i4:182-1303(-)
MDAQSGGSTAMDTSRNDDESSWSSGERILCFHGPLIYEAKIQNIEVQNGAPKYFIHYHGWNKNWDEWVPVARMLKYSEKNCAIQKDLIRAHEEKTNDKRRRNKRKAEDTESDRSNTGGHSSGPGAEGSGNNNGQADHVFAVPKTPSPLPGTSSAARRKSGLRPQKRVAKKYADDTEEDETPRRPIEVPKPPDNTVQSEQVFKSKVEIKIKIPDELKSYIVDDWEQITRHRNLCLLPAKLTVHQLLENYASAKTHKSSDSKNNKEKAIQEVTAGVREYFNVMLPSQLLYKHERPQFDQLKREDPNLVATKVYGAPHLLRLFTKLGESLVYTPLAERSTSLLIVYLHDILNYIKRNASIIFSNSDYVSSDMCMES